MAHEEYQPSPRTWVLHPRTICHATPSLKAKESAGRWKKARLFCMRAYFQSGVNAGVGSEHNS